MKKRETTIAFGLFALCAIASTVAAPVAAGSHERNVDPRRAHDVRLASPLVVSPEANARGAAVELTVAGDAYHALRGHERVTLSDFVLPARARRDGSRHVDVQLERMHVLGDAARVVVRDGRDPSAQPELPSPEVALFRGRIAGDAGSRVFLSVSGHGDVYGYVMESDGETSVLSSGPHNSQRPPVIYNPRLLDPGAIRLKPWTCDVHAGSAVPPGLAMGRGSAVAAGGEPVEPPCRRVRVAIETDFAFTDSLFGGDMEAAAAYVLTLVGAASEIFSDNVNVEFEVVYISLWSSPGGPSPSGFVSYWLDNMSHIERDLVHYFAGGGGGGWGMMWGVCDIEQGYATSQGLNGFFPYPLQDYHAQNWDPIVVTHEFGHNLGAAHTHTYCPPLDECSDSHGGFPENCISQVICQQGTMMSYCHTCTGWLTNTALTFHPVVRMTMLDYLDSITLCDLEVDGDCELAEPLLSVVYVPGDASSIEEAFWMVTDGGEILLAPGTYHEQQEFIRWNFTYQDTVIETGKSVNIRSTDGPSVTILDGSTFEGSVLAFVDTGPFSYTVQGVTITGGSAFNGGAARVHLSDVTFIDCAFVANSASQRGAAVDLYASDVAFIDCTFENNATSGFGAVVTLASDLTVTGCLFRGNTASRGGAIANFSTSGSTILIQNSAFENNAAQLQGGAIRNAGSAPIITNCTFRNNTAGDGGAVRNADETSQATSIADSLFCGNDPDAISGGYVDGGGNVIHEQCNPADLNGDGVVDVSDLLILLASWGQCANCADCPADFDGDCAVDVSDLLFLLSNWG